MDDMKLLNWFLENAERLDIVLTIIGVLIEILLMVAIYIIYKNWQNKKKS